MLDNDKLIGEASDELLRELLDAIEAIFSAADWGRYDFTAMMQDKIHVELTCTKAELLALRDAIQKAKGVT